MDSVKPQFCWLLLAALVLPACWGGSAPAPPTGPEHDPVMPLASTARLYYDNGGGISDSIRIVVRAPDAWNEVWERATSRQAAPPARPDVDFENEMVVVVGAGRMTPEDQIRVDSAGVRAERTVDGTLEEYFEIVVRTRLGCRRFESAAFPLEIVRVPRYDGTVRWTERREQPTGCDDVEDA